MNRIAQAYGYVICLVAVIVFIANVGDVLDARFTLHHPLSEVGAFVPMLSQNLPLGSYDAYRQARQDKLDAQRVTAGGKETPVTSLPPDSVLRREYQVAHDARVDEVTLRAEHDLQKHGLLLILAVLLFGSHWWWVQRREKRERAA